jgi:two-component system chemotaxis sensor kinase CheA
MENNRVEIIIADDGSGVDLEKLRTKYIRQENLSEEEAEKISESVLLDYTFKSGVSTGEMITDISGRGLGLAIVREKIEQLGGSVTIDTKRDQGTEFHIQVPLSMATFRGVRIQVGEREFIMPTGKIEKGLRLEKAAVKTIENKATIVYHGEILPLVCLADVIGVPYKESSDNYIQILVMGSLGKRIGFSVDAIIDEEVVQLKKFNAQLKRVRNIAGATVLGSGKVVPVLNVSDLLKSALKESGGNDRNRLVVTEHKKKSILVVEDSITSRMLLKNILETAGYSVSTAIDGIEGYTKLKEYPADLVVSDIDMPRMNGIDMTSKIRSDRSLGEIPIVLVTSLSRREDRERGMEAGASAYIVKSNFDQSNLLEVIERLIG